MKILKLGILLGLGWQAPQSGTGPPLTMKQAGILHLGQTGAGFQILASDGKVDCASLSGSGTLTVRKNTPCKGFATIREVVVLDDAAKKPAATREIPK